MNDAYKNHLIDTYVINYFGQPATDPEYFDNRLYQCFRLHKVITKQSLESPGSFEQGHMWFSMSAMVHSYYYCPDKGEYCGRQIWKKQEFILDSASFLDQEDPRDHIVALEPGEFLSIRYPDLYALAQTYPHVKVKLEQLSQFQNRYYRKHIELLNKPPLDRVRQLMNENPVFIACSSQETQAMHLNISLRSYIDQLNKLK